MCFYLEACCRWDARRWKFVTWAPFAGHLAPSRRTGSDGCFLSSFSGRAYYLRVLLLSFPLLHAFAALRNAPPYHKSAPVVLPASLARSAGAMSERALHVSRSERPRKPANRTRQSRKQLQERNVPGARGVFRFVNPRVKRNTLNT